MTKEQILVILRHVLTFGGGFIVAKGWIDEGTLTELIGGLMTLVGAGWSIFTKSEPTLDESTPPAE